jgi:hypothetical protein
MTARAICLTSFFERLPALDATARVILSDAPLSCLFTFRGRPRTQVLLDFSSRPARVVVGEAAHGGDIQVAIDAEVMHRVLLGELSPGEAFARREMLLRGSASHLARFIPFFDFAPLLYREHLRRLPKEASVEQKSIQTGPLSAEETSAGERALVQMVRALAFGLGFGFGLLRYRLWERLDLLEVLGSMSRGIEAARRR